jgi:hypothetical protein
LCAGDLAVGIDVLQHHLLLLERLEAAHPNISSGSLDHAIDRRGQVPAPALAFASGLDPASLNHPGELAASAAPVLTKEQALGHVAKQ